jgi:hypothetical protein
MVEPSADTHTTRLSWPAWVGGAAFIITAGTAFVLWGIRGGVIILDLVAASCF